MKTRDVYIAKSQTLADSGSWTFGLSAFDKIQHIRIRLSATNGATSNTVGKLLSWVTKIEVVDGANVLASLSGLEWMAADCFCNGCMPYRDDHGGAGVVITDEVLVLFGRFFGDREYYLDTSRYANPLLRITFAFTVSATAGVATGTEAVSIIATTIEDGALPYKGFIMRKEIVSFTSAASGDQPVILPTDYPYMGLYVSALKTTVSPDTIITNFKLTRNLDQFIDFSLAGADAFAKNAETFGPFEHKFNPLVGAAATWLSDLYFQTSGIVTKGGATAKGQVTVVSAESATWAGTGGETADLEQLCVRGCAPAATAYFPFHFGDPYIMPQPDDFLNPTGLGDLRLILTQGVVSAACTVVVEQVHP
jgi:hypothetical protein